MTRFTSEKQKKNQKKINSPLSESLKNKKILLGVCGSIAAYKAVFLTRLLVKSGAEVKVILTPSATDFVRPLTFSTLSKNECLTEYTRSEGGAWNNHVDLALWADLMLIAPATAGTISKMAHAMCDNLLIGTYMSARCPVWIAPAMDEDMFKHPANQENLKKLNDFGHRILPVDDGELASGLFGQGRMAEPETIIQLLEDFFQKPSSALKGKKVLVTAGPTYEHIDPVRFVGNHSSGKMGIAIADAAAESGAEVTLVLGPSILLPKSKNVKVIHVVSAVEMQEAAARYYEELDVAVFSAAVADYTPEQSEQLKIKKNDEFITIKLKKNVDLAQSFGQVKKEHQLSVGFALETHDGMHFAKEKLKKKNFDIIVLNSLRDKGAGFRHDTNKVSIIDTNLNVQTFELKTKTEVAADIIRTIEEKLS